jgi:small-conductance mechanosensitive channel
MTQRQNAHSIVTKKTSRAKSQSRLQKKNLDLLSERVKPARSSPHSLPVRIDPDPNLQKCVDQLPVQQLVQYRQEDKFTRPSSTSTLQTGSKRARLSKERSLSKRKTSTWQPRMLARQARRAADSMTKVTKAKQRLTLRNWYLKATRSTSLDKKFWRRRIRIRSSCSEFQMRTKWHSSF